MSRPFFLSLPFAIAGCDHPASVWACLPFPSLRSVLTCGLRRTAYSGAWRQAPPGASGTAAARDVAARATRATSVALTSVALSNGLGGADADRPGAYPTKIAGAR